MPSAKSRKYALPVSAIVPVANRPGLLADAVRSIGAGSRIPRELIVVANAAESAAADRAAAKAAFAEWPTDADKQCELRLVDCLETTQRGPGPARNAGVRIADQPWLAFLDSDDLWVPEKLERQWKFLRARPQLRAVHTAERWIKDGTELRQPAHLRPRGGRFLTASFGHCLISCSAILLERALFVELGGFDPAFPVCEDFELWLRLLARTTVGLVPEPLTIKRAGDWPQESQRLHSMDALRVQAILKFVAALPGSPIGQPRAEREAILAAAHAACAAKLAILQQGAERRGSTAQLAALRLGEQIRAAFESI